VSALPGLIFFRKVFIKNQIQTVTHYSRGHHHHYYTLCLWQIRLTVPMKEKALWLNQIKGLCICLVVIYHSVITFYPHLEGLSHPLSGLLAKCWIYFNLYLAPFRMPVFFFISGFLIRRYVESVAWEGCIDKRIWSIVYVLVLWAMLQWLGLSLINAWLAPERDLSNAANAAYADSFSSFLHGLITASTSLWYLYALVVYFVLCKVLARWKGPVMAVLVLASIAINFLPLPWWGMNSVVRNIVYYSLGAWYGATVMEIIKTVPLRRYAIGLTLSFMAAVLLWFANVPLLLSLFSIVLVMKFFWQMEQRFPPGENNILNVVGSNTIAIYTTHRILVEGFSLALIPLLNQGRFSPVAELALLLVYPFLSLLICTLVGLWVRKLSTRLFGDVFFSPPVDLRPVMATR